MTCHVAFIRPDVARKIRAGEKTVEARLSSNRPPSWSIREGDLLLFKENGGGITLSADVSRVHRFADLSPEDIPALAELFRPLGIDPASPYWSTKIHSRFAVFIEFENVIPIRFPRCYTPRGIISAWVPDFEHEFLARCLRTDISGVPGK